jgi:hypothetical protein
MNSQQRAALLAVIAELGQRYPDWRFGQLVANVAGWADQEIWDIEDEQLLQAARLHLEQLTPPAKSGDEWVRRLRQIATDCGVSLSDAAVSSEGIYE